ncbi:MAG: hypothetical protein EOP82_00005 [Variovorax sp.]|nr:MAG: hypothetical protein EOP82_00005 [Variovorax sp.]
MTDVLTIGTDGSIHHVWWDTLGQLGRLSPARASGGTIALGRDIAAVRPLVDTLVVVGIDPLSRLVALNGDAQLHLATGLIAPTIVDPSGSYRRCAGPALVSRGAGLMDAIAVDDGGNLRWTTGTLFATIGTGWAPSLALASATVFEPGARPGLVTTPTGLAYLVVGTDGLLHSGSMSALPPSFEALIPVDPGVTVSATGPVALVSTGSELVAVAVGTDRLLRAAFRSIAPGSPWTPLTPIDRDRSVSPLGGVSAVGVGGRASVVAVFPDGRPCWSQFFDGIGWLPLRSA